MDLSTIIKEVNKGNSIKFSKNDKIKFQIQKIDNIEIINFNYFGKRNIRNLKTYIHLCSKYIKLDKNGLKELGFKKNERLEILDNSLEKQKFDIKVFKRPVRKSNGAKPINKSLEKYFIENNFSYLSEFKTYRLRIRSIADYVSIENNKIVVYEVKSDVDSFIRLEKQIKDYLKYADNVYIVLHEKKLKLFIKDFSHLLDKCGLIIFKDDELVFQKDSEINKPKSYFKLLLSKEELSLLKNFKGYTTIKNKEKFLNNKFKKEDEQKIVSNILSDRFEKRNKNIYTEGILTLKITDGVLND